jgi:phenylalanyl-tRNA synthetase beta chain
VFRVKVPLSWLRELIDVDLRLDDLLEVMGRNGLEVEEVRRPGSGVDGIVLARVLEVADHPDADKLVVVTVDDGDGERTVCAGARNIAAGDLVPYARPGAEIPAPEGGSFRIGRREMRGITSDGMLCSARELQIADDHSGIMVIGGADVADGVELGPGRDLRELFPLGEPVIDVAVTADRGDLHSVYGVARDLGAILDTEVRSPLGAVEEQPGVAATQGDVAVRIDAADGCSRYVAWLVEDLAVGDSPWWLRRRLEACGVRSISNLVDVTNYVMLEVGQPLHAFDLDQVHGPEIVVRWAGAQEHLRTLDGRDRVLDARDLVIADAERPVALAGVMGGEETEVGPSTGRVLLEAAAFDSAAVRRTSRGLGLVSEASMRFERGVDPEATLPAAARAVSLLAELTGGRDAGVRVAGTGGPPPRPIRLDPDWAAHFLGLPELDRRTQGELLARAHITVRLGEDADTLTALPPSWRADLSRPADLAEEIARLHGYERIPAELPPVTLRGGLSARQRADREVRAAVRAAGFHEAQTVPFVAEDALALLAPQDEERVRLDNPLAKDAATMRPGLAEGLLASARRNVGQGRAGLALFEVGRIFRARGGLLDATLEGAGVPAWTGPDGEPLPTQPVVLGLLAYGTHQGRRWLDRERHWTVFDLLATVDEVAARLSRVGPRIEREPGEHPALHPGRTARLRWSGHDLGLVGQIHPAEAERRDLPASTVVGELLLDVLWTSLDDDAPLRRAGVLVRHPAVAVDVAVVVDDDVPYAQVEAVVEDAAGPLLDELWWFDEYRGEQVGEGRRSLAFHLRLQAPDRQLTDADAEAVIEQVATAVEAIGGALRR